MGLKALCRDVEIERAYQTPTKAPGNNKKPKRIHVAFLRYTDKVKVLPNAPAKLKENPSHGNSFGIGANFAKETQERALISFKKYLQKSSGENTLLTLLFWSTWTRMETQKLCEMKIQKAKRRNGRRAKIKETWIYRWPQKSVKKHWKTLGKISPRGMDGLSAEFYRFFWDLSSDTMVNSYNYGFQKGELSISQRQGIIRLIQKKDLSFLKNWHPISLLNIDYNIAAKVRS